MTRLKARMMLKKDKCLIGDLTNTHSTDDLCNGDSSSKKESYFPTAIASAEPQPEELFQVVRGLLYLGPMEIRREPLAACCDQFASCQSMFNSDIYSNLDLGLGIQNWGVHRHPAYPVMRFFSDCTA